MDLASVRETRGVTVGDLLTLTRVEEPKHTYQSCGYTEVYSKKSSPNCQHSWNGSAASATSSHLPAGYGFRVNESVNQGLREGFYVSAVAKRGLLKTEFHVVPTRTLFTAEYLYHAGADGRYVKTHRVSYAPGWVRESKDTGRVLSYSHVSGEWSMEGYAEVRDVVFGVADTEVEHRDFFSEDAKRIAERGRPKNYSPVNVEALKGEVFWHATNIEDWDAKMSDARHHGLPLMVHAGSYAAALQRIAGSGGNDDGKFFLYQVRIKPEALVYGHECADQGVMWADGWHDVIHGEHTVFPYVNGSEDEGSISVYMRHDMFEVVNAETREYNYRDLRLESFRDKEVNHRSRFAVVSS